MVEELILVLPVLLVSVVVHEYAHARVAVSQGDPTPRKQGRLTLNPMPHLDPMGSLLVPLGLWALSGGTAVFGWARPVQVDPRNYRDQRVGDILVSSAGVISNFILALAFVALYIGFTSIDRGVGGLGLVGELGREIARFGILINLLLAVFNLIPVPPLDGSHLLYHLLPARVGARYRELGRFGFIPLLIVFFVPGLLSALLWPVWRLYELAFEFIGLWV